MTSRQKFAVIPPSARAVRWANSAEKEYSTVLRKAGNMGVSGYRGNAGVSRVIPIT